MDNNPTHANTQTHCIGTTKGPGESAHEYTFVTPDPERQVKTGEFVYYQTQVEGQTRQILGRVTDRVPLRRAHPSRTGFARAPWTRWSVRTIWWGPERRCAPCSSRGSCRR